MPKYIQSADQARKADASTIESGVHSLVLMENAARAAADFIESAAPEQPVVFLCGPGNNGADGLACARLLYLRGISVLCLIDESRLSTDEKSQLEACRKCQVPIARFDSIPEAGLYVDCLFGSGLSREIKAPFDEIIETVNASNTPVFAMDIPSGIDGNTGKMLGHAIKADATIALDTLKEGHFRNEGRICSGRVFPFDIGIWDQYRNHSFFVLDEESAAEFLPYRPELSHKGIYKKGLMIGGSMQMQGALTLAAKACLHSGIGTLTLFTPKSAARAIASKLDEAMILPADEKHGFFDDHVVDQLENFLCDYNVFACGNGMGTGGGSCRIVSSLLEKDIPLVLDADALNCIAKDPNTSLPAKRKSPLILTPHLKEFSRISGIPVEELKKDPVPAARAFAKEHPDMVLVLKSDQTLIAHNENLALLSNPTSALAKGGSGDVLCGMITGWLAGCEDPFKAACLGVYIHNQAAHEALETLDPAYLQANDLIKHANNVIYRLRTLKNQSGKHKNQNDFVD